MKTEELWAWSFALASVLLLQFWTDTRVDSLEKQLHELRKRVDLLPTDANHPIGVSTYPDVHGWYYPVTFI